MFLLVVLLKENQSRYFVLEHWFWIILPMDVVYDNDMLLNVDQRSSYNQIEMQVPFETSIWSVVHQILHRYSKVIHVDYVEKLVTVDQETKSHVVCYQFLMVKMTTKHFRTWW